MRADGGSADAGVGVAEHAPDLRQPAAARCPAAPTPMARSAAPADLGRLVIEQQRRDEVALVERLEHVDRVDDARGIRLRELLHQRLDRRRGRRRSAADRSAARRALDALAEASAGTRACARSAMKIHRAADGQAGVAELPPVEMRSTLIAMISSDARPTPLAKRSTVTSANGFAWYFMPRQRQEQDLARRLVDGVAQRRVEHARGGRRPERRNRAASATAVPPG